MSRVLALDLGEKSLGISISDESQIIPIPLENYMFKAFDTESPISRILKVIDQYPSTELILLGYPRKTTGVIATVTKFIDQFTIELEKRINVKIKLVDERYTTQQGLEYIDSTKVNSKDKKDMMAAYAILKNYLDLKL